MFACPTLGQDGLTSTAYYTTFLVFLLNYLNIPPKKASADLPDFERPLSCRKNLSFWIRVYQTKVPNAGGELSCQTTRKSEEGNF
jgi:hypothetical protein